MKFPCFFGKIIERFVAFKFCDDVKFLNVMDKMKSVAARYNEYAFMQQSLDVQYLVLTLMEVRNYDKS